MVSKSSTWTALAARVSICIITLSISNHGLWQLHFLLQRIKRWLKRRICLRKWNILNILQIYDTAPNLIDGLILHEIVLQRLQSLLHRSRRCWILVSIKIRANGTEACWTTFVSKIINRILRNLLKTLLRFIFFICIEYWHFQLLKIYNCIISFDIIIV